MCKSKNCKVGSCYCVIEQDGYCKKHLKHKEEGTLYCTVTDCNRYVHTNGLCKAHRDQKRKYGKAYTEKEFKQVNPTRFCRVETCLNRSTGKGYCDEHKDKVKSPKKAWCIKPNCRQHGVFEGLCTKHYEEKYGLPNVDGVETPYDKTEDRAGTRCNIVNCTDMKEVGEYCTRHAILIKEGKIKDEMERIGLERCKSEGCNLWAKTEGLCGQHRRLYLKHGKVLTLQEQKELLPSGFCKEDGCLNKNYKKGYCEKNYVKYRKTVRKVIKREVCTVKGCLNRQVSKGYCSNHYVEKFGYPNAEGITTIYDKGRGRPSYIKQSTCLIKHCNGKRETGNYCLKHAIMLKEGILEQEMTRRGFTICKAEDCTNVAKTDGLCITHIDIVNTYGKLLSRQERKEVRPSSFCIVDGCLQFKEVGKYCKEHKHLIKEKVKCKVDKCKGNKLYDGLCATHYIEKYGEPNLEDIQTPYDKRTDLTGHYCRITYCTNEQDIDGYCITHAVMIQEGLLDEDMKQKGRVPCKADGCNRIAKTNGLCPSHIRVLKKHGRLLTVEEDKKLYPKRFCRVEGCLHANIDGQHCEEHKHLSVEREVWFSL